MISASQPLLECVPNFSEGSSEAAIDAIKNAIASVEGQHLLHIDPGPSANRTVFTFAGNPEAVLEAAFRGIRTAAEWIDMRFQHGAHPRLGSTDVCPLIPLAHISMEQAVAYSRQLGERVGRELGIPVYLYEYSAMEMHRKSLPQIRSGEYEQLREKLRTPGWNPDFGGPADDWERVSRTGATIIGARDILVAFNISLDTKDERIARQIARRMRTSSKGLLPALRAIGWYMDDFECAQVSMNLLDYRVTSPLMAWETCKQLAAEYGVSLVGCEVVGLIPESCVLEAGKAVIGDAGTMLSPEALKDARIKAGIGYLGLDKVKPFNPEEKILEYALARNGLL